MKIWQGKYKFEPLAHLAQQNKSLALNPAHAKTNVFIKTYIKIIHYFVEIWDEN